MTSVIDRPRGSWRDGGREWFHACFQASGVSLLLNIMLESRAGRQVGTLTLMGIGRSAFAVRRRSQTIEGTPGGPLFGLDGARITFGDDTIDIRVETGDIVLRARLRPLGWSTAPSSTHFGQGTLHWSVSPDCTCEGYISRGGRVDTLGTRAYLDHNWGDFRWGTEVAWNWAFAHLDDYAVVWMTMLRRNSRQQLGAALLMWNRGRSCATWTGAQLHVTSEAGPCPLPQVTAPASLGHILPDAAVGVPTRIEVHAHAPAATLRLTTQAIGRLVVPDDLGDGATVINEVACDARLEGMGARPIIGRGFLEVLRAA